MPFADVYLVTNKLQTISQEQLALLQKTLGFPLPVGYAEFMATLGIGDYCGLLRVYEPDAIPEENRQTQALWQEYFSWEDGRDVLPREEVARCVVFANTIDGDNLLFHPRIPDRLFVLPRHDDTIYWVPECFLNPLEWYDQSGLVTPAPAFKTFESYCDRQTLEFFTSVRTLDLADIKILCSEWWPSSEVNVREAGDDEARVAHVFVKDIGGVIELTQDSDDRRIGIRIDYDSDSADKVTKLANHLETLGFYEVGRFPA
jgi:hypothetical protein